MVYVEARALGKKRPLIPEWSVPVPVDPDDSGHSGLTLRELIERIVRSEVAAFRERQEARRFVRVLSPGAIAEGRERGKIDPGGRDLDQDVDVEMAIGTALEAFEDGVYLVLLDGEEQTDLDRQIYVSDDTHVAFIRLTFLAGG